MIIIAVMMFLVGATLVFYSIALFLANPNQAEEPTVLQVNQWSGYIVGSDKQNDEPNRSPMISSVTGSWVVPEVGPSVNNTFSGVWIGIGGYGEETLIQTGTEQEYIDGKPIYYAWYELLPDHLVRIRDIQVQPGDMVIASISLLNKNTSAWTITIWDVTRNEQFKKNVVYNSSMLSAEWIVERPKVNGAISTLADFGNVTFSDCRVTVHGITAAIGNFSFARLIMHEEDAQLVSVSPLYDDRQASP